MSNGETLLEVEEQLKALRCEQQAWDAAVQDAEQLRVAADDAEVAAIRAQQQADAMLAEARAGRDACTEELDTHLAAWQALVPQQRGPVD